MLHAPPSSRYPRPMKTLKIIRIIRGLTQWDLAEKTGIPNYRISSIELGKKKPTDEELGALAEALHVEKDQLLKDADLLRRLEH